MIWGSQELADSIRNDAVCSTCLKGALSLVEKEASRQGWGSKMAWVCSNEECSRSTEHRWFPTSRHSNKDGYELNRTLVLGMRAIGKGRASASKLSSFLGLPNSISDRHWAKHTNFFRDVSSRCAEEALDTAVMKLKRLKLDIQSDDDDDDYVRETVVDCSVSVDGSWMTRGFHSRHAFVSVISIDTGECLDRIYMCSSCDKCKAWEGRSSSPDYFQFYEDHFPECPLNHDGSSQTMEPEGVLMLFSRSLEKHKLRYVRFIGDGDSKSYNEVRRAQPYGPDVDVVKEECIGHVQKRMGTRLRNLVNKMKGMLIELMI